MFTKGNITYSEVGKYFYSKKLNEYKLSVTNFSLEDEWEEESFENPLEIRIIQGTVYFSNLKFKFTPIKLDYVEIKTHLIKTRYSNDDQIALMLNEASSEEDKVFFNKMQEWREWSGWFAKEVMKVVESQKQ